MFKMEFDIRDSDFAPEFTDEDFENIMLPIVEDIKANGIRNCAKCIMSPTGVRIGVWQMSRDDEVLMTRKVPCPRCGTVCLTRRVYRDPDAPFGEDMIYNVCCPVCSRYRTVRQVLRKFQEPEWVEQTEENNPQWVQVFPKVD